MIPDGAPVFGARGRAWGHGDEVVVLVHGLGVASRMVVPLARRLAGDRRVIAPDLPGFGASANLASQDLRGSGRWLAAGIRRLDRPAILLGCSLGTQAAVHAAAELGDVLQALVLASPTIDPRRRSLPRLVARWPLEAATQPATLRSIQLQDHRRAGPGRVLAQLRDALDDRPEDHIADVRCPVLVVRGTRDPLVSTAWARSLAAQADDGEVVVLPARHAMTFTEADELATAFDAWRRGTPRPERPQFAGALPNPTPR